MKSLKKMRAFTLIELIVVIVIIGILLALAAVGYLSFVNNSNKKASFASAKQAATVIQGLSSTSQKKATDATLTWTDVTDDGVKAGDTSSQTDGVVAYSITGASAPVAAGDLVVCGIKGSQVSVLVFAAADAPGSPPKHTYDASAGTGSASMTGTVASTLCGASAAAGTDRVGTH